MPKNENDYEKMRVEAKDKIISAALELFVKKGYAETKVGEIAEKANISSGLMYRYFKSKQELFDSITEFAISGMMEITNYLNSDLNPKEMIDFVFTDLLNELDNDYFINLNMMIIQGIISDGNPIKQLILSKDNLLFEALSKVIKKGQEERIFGSGDYTIKALLLFSSIQGVILTKHLMKDKFKKPSLKEFTALLYN